MEFDLHIPFAQWLGIELLQMADGQSELRYDPTPHHLNAFRIVHGGVSMSLLDVAMSSAARSAKAGSAVVTLEMKTSFLRPAKGPLRARGRVLQHTDNLAFCEAQLVDGSGRMCAQASGTFKYLHRSKGASDDSQDLPLVRRN